ncbi:MAG: helix-turn-helix domain-containing protein [Chloroflexota bacterium]|nr:helix-turn-helix domain-containing protein [Chloroflexota bacterium]
MVQRPVEKPVLMLEKEDELGRLFEELVVELYAEHRNYTGVATALGISRATLGVWLRLVGMRSRDVRLAALKRRGKGDGNGGGP